MKSRENVQGRNEQYVPEMMQNIQRRQRFDGSVQQVQLVMYIEQMNDDANSRPVRCTATAVTCDEHDEEIMHVLYVSIVECQQ